MWIPPSIGALRAFEAAGRTLNFTRAAEDLGQTQGAISHQIRELEARLGARLFTRGARSLSLTEAGRRYLPHVREALDRLRAGEEALRQQLRPTILTISVSPNFATKWLVPRLGEFSVAHPALDLRIDASLHHVDFSQERVDVVVRHGDGQWPHLRADRLCTERLVPVCSPVLARTLPPALALPGLARQALIHDGDRHKWRAWFAALGCLDVTVDRGPVMSQTSLAIDAAIAGQGIALARTALAALDLIAGRLVCPLAASVAAPYAYWIARPRPSRARPEIEIFCGWLLRQAAADDDALVKLLGS